MSFKIRKPAVAGIFYPENPKELKDTIDSFLKKTDKLVNEKIRGLVSPHAGYVYSGLVAGWGYRCLQNLEYDTIVILSPSHTVAFDFCSIYSGDFYETPLGKLKINHKIADEIIKNSKNVKIDDIGHEIVWSRGEHALEVQLPFLQETVKNEFSIIPIIMGNQTKNVIDDLVNGLSVSLQNNDFLIVASSDLSHYHPYKKAKEIDARFIEVFSNNNYEGIVKGIDDGYLEACGSGPVAAMMKTLANFGNSKTHVLNYANSGDVPIGKKDQVVGYLSGAVTVNLKIDEIFPTKKEQEILFNIAKSAVKNKLEGASFKYPKDIPQSLKNKSGAFVTLKMDGNLRGCIGYTQALKPLFETVREMAEAAAFEDPRFASVNEDEFPFINFEISIITPMILINNLDEFEVGKHGLMIKYGFNSGLLLPQVATEQKWNKQEFLENTCLKAGLPFDFYKNPKVEIYKFSAIIINE